jgi:hypothetical protein
MLLIICKASSTLVDGLASHEIERKFNKMGIHRSLEAYK